jgi:hypothetical protein
MVQGSHSAMRDDGRRPSLSSRRMPGLVRTVDRTLSNSLRSSRYLSGNGSRSGHDQWYAGKYIAGSSVEGVLSQQRANARPPSMKRGIDSCSAHVVENDAGWQVEATAGRRVFACRRGAPSAHPRDRGLEVADSCRRVPQ